MNNIPVPTETFRLTYGQRWLVFRFFTAPKFCTPIQRIYRLHSSYIQPSLIEALQYVVQSNASLRLRVAKVGNEWKQFFLDEKANIEVVKVRGIGKFYRSIYAQLLIAEERKKPFDLRKESPIKIKIIHVNSECLLSICLDHIAADGISFSILEQQLMCAYSKIVQNGELQTSPVDPLFEYLQREQEQSVLEQANYKYWCSQHQEVVLNQPDKRKKQFVKGSRVEFKIHKPELGNVLAFCKSKKCSLLNLIVAANLLLLYHIQGKEKIVLSVPISNRLQAKDDAIIANIFMPLHIMFDIIPNEPPLSLLTRVRNIILSSMSHRQYDYPSFQSFIAMEAKKQGGSISFNHGCSLSIEDNSLVYPNNLFIERLDNKYGSDVGIPKSAFEIRARQFRDFLAIDIRWDPVTWQRNPEDIQSLVPNIFAKLLGFELKSN